jgi:hypothetical protein
MKKIVFFKYTEEIPLANNYTEIVFAEIYGQMGSKDSEESKVFLTLYIPVGILQLFPEYPIVGKPLPYILSQSISKDWGHMDSVLRNYHSRSVYFRSERNFLWSVQMAVDELVETMMKLHTYISRAENPPSREDINEER